MSDEAIRKAFADQAYWCVRLGSPFTAAVCRLLGERLDRTTAVGRAILDWEGDPGPILDNLPLRLVGSLHALVLRHEAPELAAVYPPHAQPADERLWRALNQALHSHADPLKSRLKLAPQTNEVGRAAALMSGLLHVVHETGLSVALYELGASAGLNLNLGRFAYDLGGVQAGDPASAVKLAPKWQGAPPPNAEVRIASAQGVDLFPLSVAKAEDRELLQSYVWADQTARLARVRAAIDIARAHPPKLDEGDAADWTERVLAIAPQDGVVRVLYHTIAFQYFPDDSQARIKAHAKKVGENATKAGPFAWLRYETDPEFDHAVSLRLTLWPDGTERVLGLGHAHGQNFRAL